MREILAIWACLIGFMLASNSAKAQPIVTESTSKSETTVKSPPPSAVSPAITTINNDLCTVGVAGAVQTQILGISGGSTVRDLNCERLKLAKYSYDMGMKAAAIGLLCQDERVFSAMMNAGTPCPIDGKAGSEAKAIWESNPDRKPKSDTEKSNDTIKGIGWGIGISGIIAALLILL